MGISAQEWNRTVRDTSWPHIVHILGSLGAGGAQRTVYNLITHSKDQPFQHSVVCVLSDGGQFRALFEQAGISIYFCPLYWPRFNWMPSYRLGKWLRMHTAWTFPVRFALLITRLQADLVHSHLSAYIHLQADAVIQICRKPFVWTIHGMYRSRGEASSEWESAIDRVRKSRHAVITGVSKAALEDVMGDVSLSQGKARVIYNGIDLTLFSRRDGRGKRIANHWAIPHNAVIFGAAGRLIPIKRFELLIQAFAEAAAANNQAHLVIAGEGPLRQELQTLAVNLGIEDQVHLIGYQEDMSEFWSSVDVGILASDSEGLPMALLEACASGVPCIGTHVGGIPEVLRDGAGILVEPGNTEMLASAMKQMLDPEFRKEMGYRAHASAERFSIERTVSQYAELYRELLGVKSE